MAVTIGSNISSLQAQRRLGESTSSLTNVFERLSSGKRINRASDGAAELAIATSLNADTRVYAQGVRNGNDGLSLLSIADEALKHLSDIVVRITELATQSANGVYSNKQRKPLDEEAQALAAEYLRITQTTEFNGIKLFDGSLGDGVWLQMGYSGITASIGGAISSGEYSAGAQIGVGIGPIAVNTADLNGDGIIDIVSAERDPNAASILLGNGDGTFQQRTTLTAGVPSGWTTGNIRNALPVDLNNDGFLDIATAGFNLATTFISNGDGTFKSGENTSLAPSLFTFQVYQLASADLNNDNIKDIITVNTVGANSATILLGKGDGSFQSPVNYSTGTTPTSVAAGDLNRDGKIDLVVTDWSDDTASIFLGNGDGTFLARSTVGTGDGPHSVNLEDFNGDGNLDMLNSNQYENSVSIMLGNGDGTFQSRNIIGTAGGSLASMAADLNGDGILDVVTGNTDSDSITILSGNGDGTFQTGATVIMGNVSGSTRYVTTGDLNGDGVLDIVTAQRREDSISISFAQTISGRGALLDFSLESRADSLQSLGMLGQTLTNINKQRGVIGGSMSRIAVAIANLQLGGENFAAAESRIRDTDVAADTATLIASRIVQQAGAAILSQSNQQPELALLLLGI